MQEIILAEFDQLVTRKCTLAAELIVSLMKIQADQLHLKAGYSTLFSFLTEKYHFSESEAYKKIQACKVALKFPQVLSFLAQGQLNFSGLSVLSSTLLMSELPFDGADFLQQSLGQNKRSLEKMIKEKWAEVIVRQKENSKKPLVSVIPQKQNEKLNPASSSSNAELLPQENKKSLSLGNNIPRVAGLSEQEQLKIQRILKHHKIQFQFDERRMEEWRQLKMLFSRKYPKEVSDQELVVELMNFYFKKNSLGLSVKAVAKKEVPTESTQPTHRGLPSSLKKFVWKRDHGQCQFESSHGKKCGSQWNVQFDHLDPYALGGAHTADNLRLLCFEHHRLISQELMSCLV